MKHRHGMIHGRFQPFHMEHLRYFRLAWERSEDVIIGITNPDPSAIVEDGLSEHRHLPGDNPFTFVERVMMIQTAIREEGYPMERVFIVPFPIHHEERWRFYVPQGTAMFVVAYSDWERRKAERLRAAGLDVVLIETLAKGISGQQVRERLARSQTVDGLVPPAVARFLAGRAAPPTDGGAA